MDTIFVCDPNEERRLTTVEIVASTLNMINRPMNIVEISSLSVLTSIQEDPKLIICSSEFSHERKEVASFGINCPFVMLVHNSAEASNIVSLSHLSATHQIHHLHQNQKLPLL